MNERATCALVGSLGDKARAELRLGWTEGKAVRQSPSLCASAQLRATAPRDLVFRTPKESASCRRDPRRWACWRRGEATSPSLLPGRQRLKDPRTARRSARIPCQDLALPARMKLRSCLDW